MGSCCGKKRYKIKKFKKGSNLFEAQNMMTTISGHDISHKNMKKLKTRAEQEKVSKDPRTPPDFQIILKQPFISVDKITPNLYLTGIGGLTKETFQEITVSLVINATYEWPNITIDKVQFIRVPIDDALNDDISIYLEEVSDLIEEVAQNNAVTIVHCMAGASRSTTLVIAYLIKYKNMSLKDAFTYVKNRRETARPNQAFFQQLITYEKKIKGRNSVKIIHFTRDDFSITLPDFYEKEWPKLFKTEIDKQVMTAKENQSNNITNVKSKKQLVEETPTMTSDD